MAENIDLPRIGYLSNYWRNHPPVHILVASYKGVLVLNTPQAAGQPITWSGGFYFRVRFMADTADFENIIGHLWAAKKIEFVSVKL